jgi:LysR family hydrogen peroxide-inducible transcriptional activator
MEIRQLHYVVALAQARHFQRAARLVHVTQPTLSVQIQKLERELGQPLFERSSRQVRLTTAGERFVPHAKAILDQVQAARAEVGGDEPRGVIRLGVIPTICPYIMPSVLPAFHRLAPLAHVELFEETTAPLLEAIRNGQIDLGVLALPVEARGLSTLSLGWEEFYVAVAKGAALARRGWVDLRTLAQERLLMLQEGHCLRRQSLEFCRRRGKDWPITFQGGSLASVLRLAEAGEGVTFVPHMAREPARHPGLRFLRFHPPRPMRELGIVWRLSAPLLPTHQRLLSVLEAALRPHCRARPAA